VDVPLDEEDGFAVAFAAVEGEEDVLPNDAQRPVRAVAAKFVKYVVNDDSDEEEEEQDDFDFKSENEKDP
jgi:hypothetical protein